MATMPKYSCKIMHQIENRSFDMITLKTQQSLDIPIQFFSYTTLNECLALQQFSSTIVAQKEVPQRDFV